MTLPAPEYCGIYNRIRFLNLVMDKKDYLFGKYKYKCSPEEKIQIWKKLTAKCKAIGLIELDREYKYLRDTFWQNHRRRSLKKLEDYNKSDKSKPPNYNQEDIMMFKIIFNDRTKWEAGCLQQNQASGVETPPLGSGTEKSKINSFGDTEDSISIKSIDQLASASLSNDNPVKTKKSFDSYKLSVLTKLNLLRTNELFEIRKMAIMKTTERNCRLTELQILKLERELNISHCTFTTDSHFELSKPEIIEVVIKANGNNVLGSEYGDADDIKCSLSDDEDVSKYDNFD